MTKIQSRIKVLLRQFVKLLPTIKPLSHWKKKTRLQALWKGSFPQLLIFNFSMYRLQMKGFDTVVINVTKAIQISHLWTHISKVYMIKFATIVTSVTRTFLRSHIWKNISKVYMKVYDTIVKSVTKVLVGGHNWTHISKEGTFEWTCQKCTWKSSIHMWQVWQKLFLETELMSKVVKRMFDKKCKI